MNFLHSIILTLKMGSQLSLFSSTRLVVSKIDLEVIVSSHIISEIIPSLSPSILYHHNLTVLRLCKHSASSLQTSGTQDMMEVFSFTAPFQSQLLGGLIYLVLEEDLKSTKNGLVMGVTIGGDASKRGNNTNLLVIMRVRLL